MRVCRRDGNVWIHLYVAFARTRILEQLFSQFPFLSLSSKGILTAQPCSGICLSCRVHVQGQWHREQQLGPPLGYIAEQALATMDVTLIKSDTAGKGGAGMEFLCKLVYGVGD